MKVEIKQMFAIIYSDTIIREKIENSEIDFGDFVDMFWTLPCKLSEKDQNDIREFFVFIKHSIPTIRENANKLSAIDISYELMMSTDPYDTILCILMEDKLRKFIY